MRVVAKVVAASCCAVLAAQAEPSWLAHLASEAHRDQARTWLQALSSEDRAAEFAAALRALAEPRHGYEYDHVLRMLTNFPVEASRLVPNVVAHERQAPFRQGWPELRGCVLLPWLAASVPGTSAGEADELVAFLQERLRGCHPEVPAERPWLQGLARARLRAIALGPGSQAEKVDRVVALLEPMAGPEAICVGREVAADPSWRGVVDRLIAYDDPQVYGPGEPRFAGAVRSHLYRGRPRDIAPHALWPSHPFAARAWLLAATVPAHPLARWGHVMALGSDDALARTRAATWLFAIPPAATDGDLVVLAAHAVAAADAATQRLFLLWSGDFVGFDEVRTSFLLALRHWPETTRAEAAARLPTARSPARATWLERQLWPERVVAIGLDVGIEYVLVEVVRTAEYLRTEGRRAPASHREAVARRLYGPWRELGTRDGDEAAFATWSEAALAALPAVPDGVVPRLCRLLVDRDRGDRTRARVLLQALRSWPDGEYARPGSKPCDVRSMGGSVIFVDAAVSWRVLADIARDVPRAGPEATVLQPRDELAAPLSRAARHVGTVLVEDDSAPGMTQPFGRARDWIDELVGRQMVRGFDEVRDAAGKPLFAPVAARRFQVTDGIPVVEFVLTVVPAAGR